MLEVVEVPAALGRTAAAESSNATIDVVGETDARALDSLLGLVNNLSRQTVDGRILATRVGTELVVGERAAWATIWPGAIAVASEHGGSKTFWRWDGTRAAAYLLNRGFEQLVDKAIAQRLIEQLGP